MIHFFLIVNKQGRVRIRRTYTHDVEAKEREERESEVISKCLSRTSKQCCFFTNGNMNVAYKKFTTLCLICGMSKDENELAIQELMNVFMDCLVAYFHHVSELDVSFLCQTLYLAFTIVDMCVMFWVLAPRKIDKKHLPCRIVYNMERVYSILDEVIVNGAIGFTSKERALIPLQLLDAGS